MTNMVERVKAAIRAAEIDVPGGVGRRTLGYYAELGVDAFDHPFRDIFPALFEEATRAAILAMREPTEEMLKANGRYDKNRAHDDWQAMIDAALSPPQSEQGG